VHDVLLSVNELFNDIGYDIINERHVN